MKKTLKEDREETKKQFWDQQKKAYVLSAEVMLGFRKGVSKQWIGEDTWRLIDRANMKTKSDSTWSDGI